MITTMHRVCVALACVASTAVLAQAPAPAAPAKPASAKPAAAKAKPPPDPALAAIQDKPGLPRVLLIGDSISVGYTLPVRELLADQANVHRIPENGGPTTRGVTALAKWLGEGHWDVIHFNWGLHDLKRNPDGKQAVPIEDYEKNLRTLVGQLKASGAALIWGATTPVPEGNLNPPRSDADVQAYNAVAKQVMDENGIEVDELYEFALPRLSEIQLPVNVHFSAPGYRALAGEVAQAITAALGKRAAKE